MYYITSAKDGSIRLWAQGSLQLVKTIHLGQTWVLAMTTLPEIGGPSFVAKSNMFIIRAAASQ
jgi:hypothetical protein